MRRECVVKREYEKETERERETCLPFCFFT